MRLLSIAAASINSVSPAMLITCRGGRVGYALAVACCQDKCIVKRSAKSTSKPSFGEPGGGPGESAEACGASRVLLRTRGFTSVLKLEELIESAPHKTSCDAVFMGTSVSIKLFFEFLEDNQTMDTFLDQFPMVTRDQARAVLGASRDMLLSATSSET